MPLKLPANTITKPQLLESSNGANPYENRGDVALAFEKGGNLKDFQPDRYGFNQNVQEEINRLPEGMGLQETAWGVAKSGQPSNVDFSAAIEYQVAQKDRYGPYGELYGGVRDEPYELIRNQQETALINQQQPEGNAPIGNARMGWNPFIASAAEPTGYIGEGVQFGNTTPKQESQQETWFGGFDKFQKGISDKAYAAYGSLFGLTGEQAKMGVEISTARSEAIGNISPIPQTSYGMGNRFNKRNIRPTSKSRSNVWNRFWIGCRFTSS